MNKAYWRYVNRFVIAAAMPIHRNKKTTEVSSALGISGPAAYLITV